MKHLKHFFSRKETTLFAVALLVGIGASIVLWQVVSPGHRYEQSNNPTERSHTFTQPNSSTIQSTSTTIALNTILELESPTDRTIAIYTLVGGMNGEQIDELLNKTLDFNPSTLVQSVQATLLAELTWLDPAKAWSFVEETDTQRSENFVSTVFAEWAQFNLHEALQETSKLGRAMKNRALQAIFFSRPDLPVADRVTLVEQHGGRPTLLRRVNYGSINKSIVRSSRSQPYRRSLVMKLMMNCKSSRCMNSLILGTIAKDSQVLVICLISSINLSKTNIAFCVT